MRLCTCMCKLIVLQDFMPESQTKKKGRGRPRGSVKKAVVKSESEDSEDSKSESSASADSEEEEVVKQPAKRGRKPAAASTEKTPARKGMFCYDLNG